MKPTVVLLFSSALLLAACSSDTTTPDASCSTPDLGPGGGGPTCATNTTLNPATNACEIQASACQGGTTFDSTAFACKVTNKVYGMKIFSSPFITAWPNLFYAGSNGDAGTTACGTGTCTALGGLGVLSATPPTDDTPTFLKLGKEIGKPTSGKYPIHWETGNISDTPAAADHQTTLGDWKKCGGSWTVYNNPPSGKKTYYVVVDVAGCQPSLIFSVWGAVSNDATFANRVNAFPLGGVPNSFEIDASGNGRWERELDPNIWFKSAVAVNGNAHNPALGMGAIPDLTVHANAGFWPALNIHASGQSNGNPGTCEKDVGGNCVSPASPNIFLPGQVGFDAAPILVSPTVANTAAVAAPLSMLQPY